MGNSCLSILVRERLKGGCVWCHEKHHTGLRLRCRVPRLAARSLIPVTQMAGNFSRYLGLSSQTRFLTIRGTWKLLRLKCNQSVVPIFVDGVHAHGLLSPLALLSLNPHSFVFEGFASDVLSIDSGLKAPRSCYCSCDTATQSTLTSPDLLTPWVSWRPGKQVVFKSLCKTYLRRNILIPCGPRGTTRAGVIGGTLASCTSCRTTKTSLPPPLGESGVVKACLDWSMTL